MSCSLHSSKSVLSPLHLISVCTETRLRGRRDFDITRTVIPQLNNSDGGALVMLQKKQNNNNKSWGMKMSHITKAGVFKSAGKRPTSLQSMYVFVVGLKGDQKSYRIWFLLCVSKWNTGRGIGHYARSLRGDQGGLTHSRSARPHSLLKIANYKRQ